MKYLLILVLCFLLSACQDDANKFVVKKIESEKSGISKYTLERPGYGASYIEDTNGKFVVGDTLILVKKSKSTESVVVPVAAPVAPKTDSLKSTNFIYKTK